MLGLSVSSLALGIGAAGVSSSKTPANAFVTNDAELAAAIAAASGTYIIELADAGTFTAQANINTKSNVTLRGETYGVPHLTAGLTATSSTNCKLLGLKITRTAPNNTASYNAAGVVELANSTGMEIAFCEIASNTLSTITMQDGSASPNFFQGYRGINGAAVGTFNFHHNTIHDCYRGISIQAAASTTNYIENNYFYDHYQNPCEMAGLAGSAIYFRHNDHIGTWARTGDAGAPHSSVLGFSATAAWTPIVIGNRLMSAPQRRFAAFGTYGQGSGPKLNDTTTNQMFYTNAIIGWNLIAVEDSIALEPSLGSMGIFYNTIVKDTVTGDPAVPAMNFHDIGAGSYCCKNIVLTQIVGTFNGTIGGPNGIHSDWYTNSWDNIVLRPNGIGTTVTGDLNCYDFHFAGPTFTSLDLTTLVSAFTPKVGSYLTTDGIGAIGTGYDWSTRSYSALPSFAKPKTTNASGTLPALTQFDGTNDWMQVAGTAPVIDMTDRRALTIAFYATFDGTDTTTCSYTDSSGTDYAINKKPTSSQHRIQARYKNAAGTVIAEIDSSGSTASNPGGFGQMAADGLDVAKRLWLFTVNQTTGRFFLMRGKEIDPFPQVTTLKNDDMANNRTSFGIMGQNDTLGPAGTGLVNGRHGLFYITDQFVNLNTAANHNNIVATDGTPVSWNSNGSGLTGTQPRFYVYGDAVALNGGGLNYGSSTDTTTMNGSVTNA